MTEAREHDNVIDDPWQVIPPVREFFFIESALYGNDDEINWNTSTIILAYILECIHKRTRNSINKQVIADWPLCSGSVRNIDRSALSMLSSRAVNYPVILSIFLTRKTKSKSFIYIYMKIYTKIWKQSIGSGLRNNKFGFLLENKVQCTCIRKQTLSPIRLLALFIIAVSLHFLAWNIFTAMGKM